MPDYKDEDWLWQEYVGKGRTTTDIADDFDVTHQTINYWLDKFGIEKRTRGFREGERNPAWAGGDTEFTCPWCGSAFTVSQADLHQERKHGPYCSRECHYAHKSELLAGDGNHQYGVRGKENDTYGRTGEDHPMYGVRGEDHPAWKGGHDQSWRDGPKWRDARREALERDDFECARCGMSREEHDERFSRDLEAHHITPVFDGGEKFDVDNLVTLCQPCHKRTHRNYESDNTSNGES